MKTSKTRSVPEPPPRLVQALKDGSAVAIVGSGLSCSAGGPTWTELLHGIAAEADETQPKQRSKIAVALEGISRGRYLDAASILRETLGVEFTGSVARQIEFKRSLSVDNVAVKRALRGKETQTLFKNCTPPEPREMSPTLSHRILTQLNFAAIITTNYDLLLERATPASHFQVGIYSRSDQNLIAVIKTRKRFILKLHGDIMHLEDIVLARDDYAQAMFTPQIRDSLRMLFGTTTQFWIGYGHNDIDLDLLIDDLRITLGMPGGFSLSRVEGPNLETRFREARITPSWLESYDDVYWYLRSLAEKTDCPVAFFVTLKMPWPGFHQAGTIGERLAFQLSSPGGRISFVDARNGSFQLILEALPRTLNDLHKRLDAQDGELFRVFGKARVATFDGRLVGELSSPDDGTIQVESIETKRTENRKHLAAALLGKEGIAAFRQKHPGLRLILTGSD